MANLSDLIGGGQCMADEEFGLGCKMRSKHKIWGVGSNIGGWCKFLDENRKIL